MNRNIRDTDAVLGIDVGALAIKATLKLKDGTFKSYYRLHKGHPEKIIVDIVDELETNPKTFAATGSGGRRIAERLGIAYVDSAVALVAAAEEYDDIRHIVDIGGGSLSIVDLNEEGRFAGFRTNSLCAAGTGSFLDEQAVRMGLSLDEMARERDMKEPPRIAARCAVFAKSDLIHRQQDGFTIPEMWSGLCRGMVTTALSTLFRGRKPQGTVLLAGGVALNEEVIRWLKIEIDAKIIIPKDPSTFSSRGAIRAAKPPKANIEWQKILSQQDETKEPRRQKLELKLSKYPSFECRESYIDDETEVRIHDEITGDVIVGLDVGSTSTKAAVLNRDGEVVADFYRRTSGNPIDAMKKIFAAMERAARDNDFNIIGTGTTGSGRKMIGAIMGADRVINEITAHVKGAVATDPDVETIFEIGGQDAKFVSLKEGVPHDSNMNYVCAAGTGSFVEEQAGKLGFKLTEIGDSVMGTIPPYSTDRCTVFMEQDVHALIRKGFDRREVMGSVLYSVVQNYLNKVVGRHPYSKKKICFMGATARNKGLVAAFERLIDTTIVVSPYCHVMGAYGVANIVLDEMNIASRKNLEAKRPPSPLRGEGRGEGKLIPSVEHNPPHPIPLPQGGEGIMRANTKFVGLDALKSEVTLKRDVCTLCSNNCRITFALAGRDADESTAPSWGYLCGRDPDEKRVKVNQNFDPMRKRARLWRHAGVTKILSKDAPTIGIPLALLTHTYLPLWHKFFGELGARVVLSKPTHDGTLGIAADFIGSDYCYPLKLAHGHVRELALNPEVKHIFIPYVVQGEPHDDDFKRSVFCPYNIAFPSIAKSAGLTDSENKKIVSAVINFQLDIDMIAKELHEGLAPVIKTTAKKIRSAWLAAIEEQRSFSERLQEMGKEYLKKLEAEDSDGVVILGRPYNVCDMGANLNLPQKISDLGLTVFPVDMLPISDVKIDERFHNMYWRYGRKILQAATLVKTHPNLHAVFLTNFGCGPDSFLQTYVEKVMEGKPMLMLELDEHSADAGYITRLEAFGDVIRGEKKQRIPLLCKEGLGEVDPQTTRSTPSISPLQRGSVVEHHNLWLPPMHPYGTPFLAAALRGTGKPARPLPTETVETFEIAKGFCRGTECVPAPSTIGAFLNVLKNSDAPERECFFMPSAKGPCRFGQYHTLHRIILDEAGYKDTPIESWNDENGTYGTDLKTSRKLYNAIVAADLLYKARCSTRPYAKDRDAFDRLMSEQFDYMISTLENNGDVKSALGKIGSTLGKVDRTDERRPLVGIVGEIYVRLNVFTNQNLVETIEDAGGEAWVAPLGEWMQYLAFLDTYMAKYRGETLFTRLKKGLKNAYMMRQERLLTKCLGNVVANRLEPPIESTVNAGATLFPKQFDGESILTVGRAIEFAHQGVDLIINCAPFGCMPGTLTSGIFQKLEGKMGVPVVSLFFDGETDLRHLVRTYMENLKRRK